LKRLLTLLAGTAIFLSGTATARSGEISAQEILARVAETYRGLHDYQIEAVEKAVVWFPGSSTGSSEVRYVLAVSEPGKIRMTVRSSDGELLIVSDGTTTWWYLPHKKRYKRVSAAATLSAGDEDDDSDDDAVSRAEWDLVGRYAEAARFAPGAVLERTDQIKVGGESVRCYVVELQQAGNTHDLWIDAERFLVLRHKERVKSVKNSRKTETMLETNVHAVSIGVPPPELFDFTPPPKAREDEELELMGESVILSGKAALDFTLKDTEGELVHLADLRGKIILLDFWATWCAPCREELPHIDNLYRKLKDKGVVVLGVNDENSGTIRSFLRKHEFEVPTVVDSKRAVHRSYRVRAILTLVVIDRKGMVRANYVGTRSEEELMAGLRAAGLSD
jgi:peroxiredoxin/outer membrane lipoprotein-sorting protein